MGARQSSRIPPRMPMALYTLQAVLMCTSLAWISDLQAALPEPTPLMQRVIGNGHTAGVFDHAKGALKDWWLRPYQAIAPGQLTVDILYDTFFGLAQVNPQGKAMPGQWAPQMPLVKKEPGWPTWQPTDGADDTVFGYVGNTGVVAETRHFSGVPGVTLTTYAFAPMACASRCMVMLAKVTNYSSASVGLTLPLLINVHMGLGAPEATSQSETLNSSANGLTECRTAGKWPCVQARSIDGQADQLDANGPLTGYPVFSNSYQAFQQGLALPKVSSPPSVVGDDLVGGLFFSVAVASGEQAIRGAVLQYQQDPDDGINLTAWLANRGPEKLLADEIAGWQVWHAATKGPPSLSPADTLLFQRQLTILKMAQCQQADFGVAGSGKTPFGQIVASLPPGLWAITWPRDQSYAAVALAASGHLPEAKAALEFVLKGKVGEFQNEVGLPYRVSVTRYFGGGLEESDSNELGPNIELDGFGLVLWQAGRYVQASNDLNFIAKWWPDLRDLVVTPLVAAIDSVGVIKPDSSIWEVHWQGQQKHFAYTSMTAVRGLCAAAQLATLAGQGTLAFQYRTKAKQLRDSIVAKFAPNDTWLRGNLEEPAQFASDLAAVEALTDGQIAPWGPIAQASWLHWNQTLQAGGGVGFVRNDDGGWYDSQEWLFIDLRVLRWLQRAVAAGAPLLAQEQALRQRVVAIAHQGGGLVPELIATSGAQAGQFAGATPMMGFGAGALALALGGQTYADDLFACLGEPASPAQPEATEPTDAGANAESDTQNTTDAVDGPEFGAAAKDYAVRASDGADAQAVLTDTVAADVKVAISDAQPAAAPSKSSDSGCVASATRGPVEGDAAGLLAALVALVVVAARRGRSRPDHSSETAN